MSACTEECLPEPAEGGRARIVRRVLVMLPVLLSAVVGAILLPGPTRQRWVQSCGRGLLAAAGVELRVVGADRFADGGALVVANHLSWIEVVALGAVQPVRLLAKREVRGWPLIGVLAARTGALFVDRAELRALPATVADTATALRAGAVVAVFPEGTTHCGQVAGPFRRAAFQAALDAGVPVRPVAVRLLEPAGTRAADVAFVGEQTLVDAIGRVLRRPRLICEITVLPALRPTGGRRELARLAGAAVASATGVPHPARRAPQRLGTAVAA